MMPVVRLFNYFYKTRPNLPRYQVTWDVGVVLRFLAQWHPKETLSLKQLTLKTVMLVALTSSDRAQTLHALRRDQVEVTEEGLVFVVLYPSETHQTWFPGNYSHLCRVGSPRTERS